MRRTAFILTFLLVVLGAQLAFGFDSNSTCPRKDELTLGDAVAIALKCSPVIRAGRWGVNARHQGVRAAWGAHLPQVDFQSSYTRLSDPMAVVPIKGFGLRPPMFSKNIYQWKAVGYLPIYEGGRISRQVEISKLEEEISSNRLQLSQEELVADVTNLFNRMVQLRYLKKAQSDALAALEKVHSDTASLLKVGRVAPVDLMRIETQVSAQKQDLVATEELIERTKETLAYLLGWSPESQFRVDGELRELRFNPRPDLQAILRRPDVKAAMKAVKEAEKKVSYEFGAHLPSLYLSSSYGDRAGAGFHGKEEVWQAGAYLKLNIFSGGTISARVRQAKAELFQAQNLLQNTRLRARQEILHSTSSIAEARARIEAAKQALESAKESFRIEKLRYTTGAGTVTDMLLAQAQWLESRARYYQALYDYHSAVVAYRLATASILEDLKGENQ